MNPAVAPKPVLYLGDTSLSTAAGYLAGLMSHDRVGYDYLPSDRSVNGETDSPRALYIVSDYPARMMGDDVQRRIVAQVTAGAGLLMIGGWESFHGQNGHWNGTPLGNILPVTIEQKDDRVNCDQPAVVVKTMDHPIVSDLPWDDRPPTIGGFNRITPKADAQVLLEVQRFSARRQGSNGQTHWQFQPTDRHPVLVIGQHGKGRTAALATDIAPHWVGGLVDWGKGPRVVAEAPHGWEIEVGSCYARFIHNLVSWTGRLDRR